MVKTIADMDEYEDVLAEVQNLDRFGRWVLICELLDVCSFRAARKAIEIAKREAR